MFTRLLITLDGSQAAEQVLPYGRFLARALELPVELLTIVDPAGLLTSTERARRYEKLLETSRREGEKYLQVVAKTFAPRVKWTLEEGGIAEAIIENAASSENTLIAMTTHGRSGLNRWLLGSVAEKVLRATTSPLLLIRASQQGATQGEARLSSIVVPLDGSALAERALPVGAHLARKLAIEIFLLRAYTNPYKAFSGGVGPYAVQVEQLLDDIRSEARGYLEDKMAQMAKEVESVSPLLEEKDAAEGIVALANRTPESLIVMSSHGRSGVRRWVFGSVAETVVRHSNSPVLILRSTTVDED